MRLYERRLTMPPNHGDVGRLLTVLRVSRRFNQHELARRSGVHNSSISEYERGRTVPEYATIVRILAGLGYPESALDRTRQFLAALDGAEWGLAPQGAPPQAADLAHNIGKAAEHFALTFLEIQAGGWPSPKPNDGSTSGTVVNTLGEERTP